MIKPKELQDWLQVLGLFGVVASLIFVGLEMRQSHQIARSQANQARTDATTLILLEAAANPFVLSTAAKIASGQIDEITDEEMTARRLVLLAQLFHYENLYQQYRDGFISEERWAGSEENLSAAMRNAEVVSSRQIYEAAPNVWSSGFQELVDRLLSEIDSESP